MSLAVLSFVKKHGVSLVPLVGRGLDMPYEHASSREDVLETWFGGVNQRRRAGLPCGAINNLVVIDCDVKNGGNGIEEFAQLCKLHRDKPSSVYQTTPSGGRHYFYQYDERASRNLVKVHVGGRPTSIDVRSNRGHVVVDPEGKIYSLKGSLKDAPPLPEWLIDVLYGPTVEQRMEGLLQWVDNAVKVVKDAREGKRNDTLNKVSWSCARFTAHDQSLRRDLEAALIGAGRDCGLDPDECVRTVRSGLDAGYKKGCFLKGERIPSYLMKQQPVVESREETEEETMGQLPPPPLEVFPPKISGVIREMAAAKSVPEEMVVTILLALVSACLGRARGVVYDDKWKENANLFFLLVAETGAGKSHTFKDIFHGLLNLEAEKKQEFIARRRQYEQDMIAWKKSKGEGEAPQRPRNIQYLLDDATMEAVSERLEDNPRGLFWTLDEFAGFFASLDKYNRGGNDGKRRLLSAWNSEVWNSSRKTRDNTLEERYVRKGCIGIFGGIQPHLLQSVFSWDDVNQGLPQRFLYTRAPVTRPMVLPTPRIAPETYRLFDHMARRLLSLNLQLNDKGIASTVYLRMDESAVGVFEHFANTMVSRTFGSDFYGYAVKLIQMTLRLSVIMHHLQWASGMEEEPLPTITSESMEPACRLIDWFATHTRYIKAGFPSDNSSDYKRKKADEVHSLDRAVASALAGHAEQILRADNIIMTKELREWTENTYSGKTLGLAMNRLGARPVRGKAGARGYEVDMAILARCRKMSSIMNTIMTEDEDE